MHLCTPGPVVQWIEYKIPVLTIWVRFPSGLQSTSAEIQALVFFLFNSSHNLLFNKNNNKFPLDNRKIAQLSFLIAYSDTTEKSPRNRRYGLFRSYFVPERHCKSLFQRIVRRKDAHPAAGSATTASRYARYAGRFP